MEKDSQNEFQLLAERWRISLKIIEVFGFPLQRSYSGGFDTRSFFEITSANFSAKGDVYISTSQLNDFAQQLKICMRTLTGSAMLNNPPECNFALVLTFDGLGHVNVSGKYKSLEIELNELQFEFETDQTHFFQIIPRLETILSVYVNSTASSS